MAFFLPERKNLDSACLSQMKLRAENAPPARMKRAVKGLNRMREASAMIREKMRISSGIRLRIFSSSEMLYVIINNCHCERSEAISPLVMSLRT